MKAAESVIKNKRAAGVDRMSVHEMKDYMKVNAGSFSAAILSVKYTPQTFKRVWIPKDNGKIRGLGVPSVIDRVVQQPITNLVSMELEPMFSDSGYGHRPKRST